MHIAEARLQTRLECEARMSRSGTRDPNQQDQNVKLDNPATGVGIETVDSAQQLHTPTSQIVGSPLVLGKIIGTTTVGNQQGAPGRLPGSQGKALINPAHFPTYGVENGSYQAYQRMENDKYQHHAPSLLAYKPPASATISTSGNGTQTIQLVQRRPPPACDSGRERQYQEAGAGGDGGRSNDRDGKGRDPPGGQPPPDRDPPPKREGNLHTISVEAEETEVTPLMEKIMALRIGLGVSARSANDFPEPRTPSNEEVICPMRMFVRHCLCSERPQQSDLGINTL